MPYAGTVTITPAITLANAPVLLQPGQLFRVRIAETATASTSESEIPFYLPFFGTMLAQRAYLSAGTGTTVDPILGTTTAPAGIEIVAENDTAAATVSNAPTGGVPFYTSTGSLFHRSRPDSASDNTVAVEYLFRVEGR